MVIIMGSGISTVLLGTLYILQVLELSNGWDVLTTGGFFTKNKVFGTIAEAQAPAVAIVCEFRSSGLLVLIGNGIDIIVARFSRIEIQRIPHD